MARALFPVSAGTAGHAFPWPGRASGRASRRGAMDLYGCGGEETPERHWGRSPLPDPRAAGPEQNGGQPPNQPRAPAPVGHRGAGRLFEECVNPFRETFRLFLNPLLPCVQQGKGRISCCLDHVRKRGGPPSIARSGCRRDTLRYPPGRAGRTCIWIGRRVVIATWFGRRRDNRAPSRGTGPPKSW